MGVAEMIKYTVFNTKRQRMMNETFTLDVKKISPEVAKMLANNSIPFMFELFLHERWRVWCVEHFWRERIYRHIRSADEKNSHIDLPKFIEKVWLDVLKNHPDGMWILMKCMSQELKGKSFEEVRFDAFWNAYFKKDTRWEIGSVARQEYEHKRKNFPYGSNYGMERMWKSLDGRSVTFDDDETVITTGEYVTCLL